LTLLPVREHLGAALLPVAATPPAFGVAARTFTQAVSVPEAGGGAISSHFSPVSLVMTGGVQRWLAGSVAIEMHAPAP